MTGLISGETWKNMKTLEGYKSAISISTLGRSRQTKMLLPDRAVKLARAKPAKLKASGKAHKRKP